MCGYYEKTFSVSSFQNAIFTPVISPPGYKPPKQLYKPRVYKQAFPGFISLMEDSMAHKLSLGYSSHIPGPRGFLLPRRDETRERKKRQEKTSGRID